MTTVAVRPLTARSAILSLLLGSHPASAPAGRIVSWGSALDIKEPAVRTTLSRMVAAGDVLRDDAEYRLGERLLARQARQDAALDLAAGTWDGTWLVAVVAVGADASSRADLRRRMSAARFAELREGVWMRPATFAWTPPTDLADRLEVLRARPDRAATELVTRLFDVDAWAAEARDLARTLASTPDLAGRVAVAAAIVRHLVVDPLLPADLLPADWPGADLRRVYDAFRHDLGEAHGTMAG